MRWQRLFDDLEAEAVELAALDRDAEICERTRAEVAAVRWLDRLRGSLGAPVTLELLAAGPVRGTVRYVGPDWVLLDEVPGDALVRVAAVLAVEGTGRSAPAESATVPMTWGAAWRRLAAEQAVVRLVRVDGGTLRGTVRQVGADFVEIDRGADRSRLLVCFTSIAVAHAPVTAEL
ncbi:hypothetical protein BH20ACT6_BH20ACT6_10450 [soil metagenome]